MPFPLLGALTTEALRAVRLCDAVEHVELPSRSSLRDCLLCTGGSEL
jgi:hypothetical protein